MNYQRSPGPMRPGAAAVGHGRWELGRDAHRCWTGAMRASENMPSRQLEEGLPLASRQSVHIETC